MILNREGKFFGLEVFKVSGALHTEGAGSSKQMHVAGLSRCTKRLSSGSGSLSARKKGLDLRSRCMWLRFLRSLLESLFGKLFEIQFWKSDGQNSSKVLKMLGRTEKGVEHVRQTSSAPRGQLALRCPKPIALPPKLFAEN